MSTDSPRGTSASAGSGIRSSTQENLRNVRVYADRGRQQIQGTVNEYPLSSVLVSFGVGFGIGLLLSSLAAEEPPTPWQRTKRRANRLANRAGGMAEHYTDLAENLGRQVVDTITKSLPDLLSRKFHR